MDRRVRKLPLVTVVASIALLIVGCGQQANLSTATQFETAKVTICHVPPGDEANAHEITIGEPAVEWHFAKHEKDSSGPCESPPNGCTDVNYSVPACSNSGKVCIAVDRVGVLSLTSQEPSLLWGCSASTCAADPQPTHSYFLCDYDVNTAGVVGVTTVLADQTSCVGHSVDLALGCGV